MTKNIKLTLWVKMYILFRIENIYLYYNRESEGDPLDNSGMSISYCEGTAHSLPLVGSPRFLMLLLLISMQMRML